eukprot:CAMPEP_0169243840 /NCGR_PEP_ID=MMETSP1016-20121227/33312_1 /TAXON_ID=342587 /ORGANISM="Karlodinium micrum, Strain CCMP2283" /LENGTH=137 /DNA_ID=CAMNT_0009324173 /DNA_START=156 /DNA_END=566 /DNA_ORIENTATION=+
MAKPASSSSFDVATSTIPALQDIDKTQVGSTKSVASQQQSKSPPAPSESGTGVTEDDDEEEDDDLRSLIDAEGVGPGRSAEFDKHVELFKKMQLESTCFDAYARAALSAAANQVLLVLGYFVIGHCMVKDDVHTGKP